MDGEHGYYSEGVIAARTCDGAVKQANRAAKYWYEDKHEAIENNSQFPLFEFVYQCVTCQVDELREIQKEHYDILKQYL